MHLNMENSLLSARCARLSLTGNELFDNVIFAVALQVTTYFVRDILARIVYMQPRPWMTSSPPAQSLSYHAQARMAIYDNFTRRIWRGSGFSVSPGKPGRYSNRNRIQFAFVLAAAGAGILCDIAGTSLGLPTSRAEMARTDEIMNWRSVMPAMGRLARNNRTMQDYPCETFPIRDGPNLRSRANWIMCSYFQFFVLRNQSIIRKSPISDEPFYLFLAKVEHSRHGALMGLVSPQGLIAVHYSSAIVHDGTFLGHVTFNSSTEECVRHFTANVRLLENRMGLGIYRVASDHLDVRKLTGGIFNESDMLYFEINTSDFRWPAHIPVELRSGLFRLTYVLYAFDSIMRGIFEYRGQGSKLYKVDFDSTLRHLGPGGSYLDGFNSTFRLAIRPIESKKIVLANYTGTVLPGVYALILCVCVLFLQILVRLCFKDPPGLGWEVITAHRRKCTDKLLSGPDATVELTRSRRIGNPTCCHVGYGVPPGFHPEERLFRKDDIVEASALNSRPLEFDEDMTRTSKIHG